MAAPTSVKSPLAAAQAATAEIADTIKAYGVRAAASVKAGAPLEDVSAAALQAAEMLAKASEDVDNAQYRGLPVDKAMELLSRALVAVSSIADKAGDFDRKHAVTQKLYTSVEGAVAKAKLAIDEARTRLATTQASMSATVSSAAAAATSKVEGAKATLAAGAAAAAPEPLKRAYAALQDVTARLSTKEEAAAASSTSEEAAAAAAAPAAHSALNTARELLARATEEVGSAVTHFKDAPLTDKPVVASLEALGLARTALTALAGVVTSAYESSAIAAAVSTAHAVAVAAVAEATATLTALRERVNKDAALSAAASAASSGVDFAVRKAAELDASYDISARVTQLDETYHVSQRLSNAAVTAKGTALQLNEQYQITEKATAALRSLDDTVTGGRGTAAAAVAVAVGAELATTAATYLREVADKFGAAKAGIAATSPATSTSPSTAQPASAAPAAAASGEAAPASASVDDAAPAPASTDASVEKPAA